ncbi:N-6 DNA methylase [Streptomyces sp. NPDC014733]|uniref:N-6 DNA methylase n=1 Tax=Streptomyces sp. NPDC014733 TaxID=3364885 RepID=UPI0036F7D848
MTDDFMPRTAATIATVRPVPSWAKNPSPKPTAHTTNKITARRYAAPNDPHAHAHKIADNVLDAWHQNFGGSSIDIPLGTVAGLCLLRNLPGVADLVLNLTPEQLPQLLKEIYLGHWIKRPDLINRAIRLHDWAWNPSPAPQQLRAAHAVTRTAINTGLLDLTGHDDPQRRAEADVLSPLLTNLRHKSDKKWRGEYHTPACVSDLMANMTIDEDSAKPGMTICEPAIGSGMMFRSVAQRLRDLGLSTHDFGWYGNDVDSLSAACAAVNAIIWDLGPRCLIGCANSLTRDDDYAKTRTEALEAFEERDRHVETATTIAAHRRALAAFDNLMAGAGNAT